MKLTKITGFSLLAILAMAVVACPASLDEKIRESVRVPGLQEGVQARDVALEAAVEGNIMSDLELRSYAQQHGIEIVVSHTVATVHMKVKTDEMRDRALELAENTEGVSEVIDEIEVDPTLPGTGFEEIW